MFMDPTTLPITEKKLMGLWPPSKDNIADSMYPYIKRMKQENVSVLMVGDVFGAENSFRFSELDARYKIKKLDLVEFTTDEAFKTNLLNIPSDLRSNPTLSNTLYDLVYINSNNTSLFDTMAKYYEYVSKGGIFCGDNHHTVQVKESLGKFRRENKIGTPISVSNRLCWFWIKR